MKYPSFEIVEIQEEQLNESVNILARAFENDPTTRYLFSEHAAPIKDAVWELYLYICERQLNQRLPILGAVSDSRLVGVACIQPPDTNSQPNQEPSQYEMRFGDFIGEQVMQRMIEYGQVTSAHLPNESHVYLTAVGVHPDEQGKGYGRALLDAVHKLSDTHPTSMGVSLDTGNAVNVPMYEHFGYNMVAKTKLEELDLWCMFRSNRKRSA